LQNLAPAGFSCPQDGQLTAPRDDLLVARSRDGRDQAVAAATSTPFTVSIVL